MKSVYLDNGATSFPKAPGVVDAMVEYMTKVGSNVNRGAYDTSYTAEQIVFETRTQLMDLFDGEKPEHVVFTCNVTESLNVLLKGFLKSGDHVVTSGVEHNAVMRPLRSLEQKGVLLDIAPCTEEGDLDLAAFRKMIRPDTRLVVMTHASNVCGTVIDLRAVGEICRSNDIRFIVDAAQTAGVIPVSMKTFQADAIAFTGHKSLLGPQGMGGFVIKDSFVSQVAPLIEGGTGSRSDSEMQPEFMPDKFEAGTPNIPGIYGLNAAMKYIFETGMNLIHEKEMALTYHFIEGLKTMDHVRIIGKKSTDNRTAVVSVDFPNEDNGLVAHYLDRDFNIKTRCGMHCAPAAHNSLKTFPKGTVRFSFGFFNSFAEVDYALQAIRTCRNI